MPLITLPMDQLLLAWIATVLTQATENNNDNDNNNNNNNNNITGRHQRCHDPSTMTGRYQQLG